MNQKQFEIVKVMQHMGIKPHDFAKACHTAASLMLMAYAANNYEQFKTPTTKEEAMDSFNDLFGGMFGKGL